MGLDSVDATWPGIRKGGTRTLRRLYTVARSSTQPNPERGRIPISEWIGPLPSHPEPRFEELCSGMRFGSQTLFFALTARPQSMQINRGRSTRLVIVSKFFLTD
jgi:hypothetical protein